MIRQYPTRGGDFVGLPYGENVVDDLAVMPGGYGQKLQNMEYALGTLRRRGAFVLRNTAQYSALATAAIEYVDHDGTARLVFASNDGKIQEDASTSYEERVTSLTAGLTGAFAQILGACFHQNGYDAPKRGDGAAWRDAGAPAITSGVAVNTATSGSVTGTYLIMVTACIEQNGVVILESDHSEYTSVTVTNKRLDISWAASGDPRVNLYRVYRPKNNQGTPFYLLGSTSDTSFQSNTTDAALSAQLAPILGRNGVMPVGSLVRRAGQRLVVASLTDAQDPDASKAVHVSAIAVTSYDAEYFPVDGIHRFYLPGKGAVKALFPYSVKDEDNAARDLFLAQEDSCYILRDTDPYGVLEPVSLVHGVVSKNAITQWGRFLFFVSKQGLMFLGEGGDPVLISQRVNPYFFGGGPLSIQPNVGSEYISLEVYDNKLLITLRDSTGAVWGNKALVMDLERFSPSEPMKSAYFTNWNITSGGMALFIPTQDGGLALFDNQNLGLLKRGVGYQDHIKGAGSTYTLKLIKARIWTFGMMAKDSTYLKVIRQVNLVLKSGADSLMDLEADYGGAKERNKVIPTTAVPVVWNKDWDKPWFRNNANFTSVYFSRLMSGRFFQAKILAENTSADFIFVGISLHFTMVTARRMVTR